MKQCGEVTILTAALISALMCFAQAWASATGVLPAWVHPQPRPEASQPKE